MEKIIEKLKQYDDAYYNGEAFISDEEYDRLRDNAKSMNPEHPYFENVGAIVAGSKVKLPFVLGSLDKKKPDTIEKWWKENEQAKVISLKLDGQAFYVKYRNGKVYRAATRGNGTEGRDITEKAKIFCPLAKTDINDTFRGEATLIGDDYLELGYNTRRNGVAGLLNKDSNENVDKIFPIFHEVLDGDMSLALSEQIRLDLLRREFPDNTVFYSIMDDELFNVDNLIEMFNMYKTQGLDIDGLVITDLYYSRENVMRPKRKIAFKIAGKSYKTKVMNVEWTTSRTGRIVPVVEVVPVDIEGVNVSRTTGFNYDYIKNNKIGIGSEIEITRSGDVIPYITKVLNESKSLIIPKTCPACDFDVKVKGVDIVCVAPECWSKAYKKVENFLITLGTSNITEKTLMKLGLDTIEKCYEIDEFEIETFDGFGLKRAQQIVDEIQKTLNVTPERFIAGYGIPNVSTSTAKELMKYFDNDFDKFCKASLYELQKVSNIGEITAKNIAENISNVCKLYRTLNEKYGFTFRVESSIMNGLKFTLTGKGDIKRPELQKLIENNGGEVRGISKSVNYLVTDNPDSQSGKSKKAREYGIEIISYKQLMEMLKV